MASDYSDDDDVNYSSGDIVWVKLGQCWWPGEVTGTDDVPEDVVDALKKMPLAFVKFFEEDQFEYVRNPSKIYPYSCSKKEEFIRKGMALARSKPDDKVMCKFAKDIVTAETRVGGNPDIVNDNAFLTPETKVDYRNIFGDPSEKRKPKKEKEEEVKGKKSKTNKASLEHSNGLANSPVVTPARRPITHPRFIGGSDHEVRIRQQPTTPPKDDTKTPCGIGNYKCQLCDFASMRLNVIVLHTKAVHSESAVAAKASQEAEKAKSSAKKRRARSTPSVADSTDKVKRRKSDAPQSKEKVKRKILTNTEDKSEKSPRGKVSKTPTISKRNKTGQTSLNKGQKKILKPKSVADPEVREKLLADWDEEEEEEEVKEIEKLKKVIEKTVGPVSTETEEDQEKVEESVSSEANEQSGETAEELSEKLEAVLAETSVPELPDLPDTLPVEIDKSELKEEEDEEEDEAEAEPGESEVHMECCDDEDTEVKEERIDMHPDISSEVAAPDDCTMVSTSPLPEITKTEELVPVKKTELQESVHPDNVPLNYTQSALSRAVPLPVVTSNVKSEDEEMVTVSVPIDTASARHLPHIQAGNEQRFGAIKKENYQTVANDVAIDNETSGDGSGQQTYVLVTFGDSGTLQPSLDNLENTTLLALDGSQGVDEQGTRTLYIDPSTLTTNSELHNLLLAIDASEGSDMAQSHLVEMPQHVVNAPGTTLTSANARAPTYASIVLPNTPTTAVDAAKSAQDILAVALANTQVLQTADGSVTAGQSLLVQPPIVSSVTNTYQSQQHQVMSPYTLTGNQAVTGASPLGINSQQHQGRSGLPSAGALPSFSSHQIVSSHATVQSTNSGNVPVMVFQPTQDVHNRSLPITITNSLPLKRSMTAVAPDLPHIQKFGGSGR